jgi:hypothetical protein
MSSSKKIYLCRDFAAGVYLSETQNPIPPSLTHCIRVYSVSVLYTYSHREGRGGVQPDRRLEGQQFTKLDRK